jgi:hypothetical protein
LFDQGAGPGVWIVDNSSGAVKFQPVQVAAYGERDVLLKSGVAEGDQVVVLGVQKLDAGQRVRVVDTLGL